MSFCQRYNEAKINAKALTLSGLIRNSSVKVDEMMEILAALDALSEFAFEINNKAAAMAEHLNELDQVMCDCGNWFERSKESDHCPDCLKESSEIAATESYLRTIR